LSNYKSYKEYEFDYIIEYKSLLSNKDDKSVFFLTNSNDNSYWASFYSIDKNKYRISFYKPGSTRIHATILKQDFFKAATILMNRDSSGTRYIDRYSKKNHVSILKDTIVNNLKCKQYVYQSIRSMSNNLDVYYIVEPKTEFHLPMITYGIGYKQHKLEKTQIPSGIFKELFYRNENEEIVEGHYKLLGYQPYEKSIRVKY
jgi:hypothetical protein